MHSFAQTAWKEKCVGFRFFFLNLGEEDRTCKVFTIIWESKATSDLSFGIGPDFGSGQGTAKYHLQPW